MQAAASEDKIANEAQTDHLLKAHRNARTGLKISKVIGLRDRPISFRKFQNEKKPLNATTGVEDKKQCRFCTPQFLA